MKQPIQSWDGVRRTGLLRLLQMYYEGDIGDVRDGLSCLDLMLAIHHKVLGTSDRFVLSDNRFAAAYYVTLWTLGRLADRELSRLLKEGARLNFHPLSRATEDFTFVTGGHGSGLGLAAGLALAKHIKGEPGHVYCLMSERQWYEGVCWAALSFARRKRLESLTVLVARDEFGSQGTEHDAGDVLSLAPRLRASESSAQEIDGHDPLAICRALQPEGRGLPHSVLVRTRKGFGVSFLEDRSEQVDLSLSESQYLQAVQEIEAECARHSVNPSATPPAARSSCS